MRKFLWLSIGIIGAAIAFTTTNDILNGIGVAIFLVGGYFSEKNL